MSVALVALLVENIWQEKVQDSQLHQTLKRAYVKAINQNMEAIHEFDEEYVTPTFYTCSQKEQLVNKQKSQPINKKKVVKNLLFFFYHPVYVNLISSTPGET